LRLLFCPLHPHLNEFTLANAQMCTLSVRESTIRTFAPKFPKKPRITAYKPHVNRLSRRRNA